MSDDAISERAPARLRPFSVPDRGGGLIMAGTLAATALFFVVQSLAMDLGTFRHPGAGFLPLGLGVLLLAFSVAIVVDTLRVREVAPSVEFGHRDVLVVFGCLTAIPILFEPVGAYITLGGFSAAILFLVGRVRLWRAILASAVAMVVVRIFFADMLGLRLPAGLLDDIRALLGV